MNKYRINLYAREFKLKKTVLSLNQLCIIFAIVIALLSAVLCYSAWQYQTAMSSHKDLNKELTQLQDEMRLQEKRLENRLPSPALVNQINTLKTTLLIKSGLLQSLLSQNKESRKGYSQLLADLAKTQKGNLWLTHIYASGKKLNLQGESLSSEALPSWLIQFKQLPTLADTQFTSMQMWRGEEQSLFFKLTGIAPEQEQ